MAGGRGLLPIAGGGPPGRRAEPLPLRPGSVEAPGGEASGKLGSPGSALRPGVGEMAALGAWWLANGSEEEERLGVVTIGSARCWSGAWTGTKIGSGSTTSVAAPPLAGEGTGGSLGSGLGQALPRRCGSAMGSGPVRFGFIGTGGAEPVDRERGCELPLPLKGVVGLEGDSGSCLAMLGLLGSLAT